MVRLPTSVSLARRAVPGGGAPLRAIDVFTQPGFRDDTTTQPCFSEDDILEASSRARRREINFETLYLDTLVANSTDNMIRPRQNGRGGGVTFK